MTPFNMSIYLSFHENMILWDTETDFLIVQHGISEEQLKSVEINPNKTILRTQSTIA